MNSRNAAEREERKARAAMEMHRQWQEEKSRREDQFWNDFHPDAKQMLDNLKRAQKALNEVVHVDPGQVETLLREKVGIAILDLRPPGEFDAGHIPQAINRNFQVEDFKATVQDLDKQKPWLVYCASGEQSAKAVKSLVEVGIFDLYHLDGGFAAWNAANLPVQ